MWLKNKIATALLLPSKLPTRSSLIDSVMRYIGKGILRYIVTWIKLEDVMLNEIS